ncbi:alpha/beta hydrolase fold family protein [Janthinobacterium agaricidamnosum NBRC 102515 = DSM 9628]|uniref:Alpha/beta hydrolase fold family protein n=3 Tax=Janthinobacterium agaricidamnosum TaxID=55508 RepID=W0V772_9BURK|nr:alpha/beta hydrolase fold family protein [Janthinobacterium agaricidamnosum NBRC 102515 = DSM 9628]
MNKIITILAAASLAMSTVAAHASPQPSNLSQGPHDVDVGEVSLHYVVKGQGPLLFMASPGWGAGSNYMQNSMTPLEQNMTLIYIDMRGNGKSTRPVDRARMSQSAMADDIDRLRVLLGQQSINLLGHSDGGTIAIEYALRHPEHLDKVVLVAPYVLGDTVHGAATKAILDLWTDDPHYRDAIREKRKPDDGKELTDQGFQKYIETILPLYMSDPVRFAPQLASTFGDTRVAAYARYAENYSNKLAPRNQAKELGKIKAKTLIINGTVDWVCPYQMAQQTQAAIPGSRLSLYANKAHFPWLEDPQRFFKETSEFLLN